MYIVFAFLGFEQQDVYIMVKYACYHKLFSYKGSHAHNLVLVIYIQNNLR
jgi:hypothetical protein